jgi:hypothetical protein
VTAALPEITNYDPSVYQLQKADPVQGYDPANPNTAPNQGISNQPLLNLANRTNWLYTNLNLLIEGETIPSTVAPLNSPAFTGTPLTPTPPLGDSSQKISDTSWVNSTIAGVLNLSVAGGVNVSLSANQAGNGTLNFTGALTANIAVIVPSTVGKWTVENNTTGPYTLTLKTAAGSGVAVTQGKIQSVFGDGTNVYPQINDFPSVQLTGAPTAPTPPQFDSSQRIANTQFVKQSGFQFSQTTQYAAGPIVLAASQAGSVIDLASSYSGPVTLPALSAVPDGATFMIWSGSPNSVPVNVAGSDVIFVNGSTVTSITLKNGDTLILEKSSVGSTCWIAIGGSAQFAYSATYATLAPKPSSSAGAGQWQTLVGLVNAPANLPSGGTWGYFAIPFNASGQASTSSPTVVAGVAAGGTAVGAATPGYFWYGFAWRIQ